MKTDPLPFRQLKNKTFIFTINITKTDIDKAYETTLKTIATDFESKGFRKGKVPLDIVKANTTPESVVSETLNHLVTRIYPELISKHQLKPITDPQIKILNPPLSLEKEWQLEISGCELPDISLNSKYLEAAKLINQNNLEEPKKLDAHFDNLLEFAVSDIPPILIKSDTQKHLADLVDQTQQANITVAQYLKSRNTTIEEYQKKLENKVRNEWILNLAISQIAKDEKLVPNETEVGELTAKNPQLKSNPNLAYYLLTQQKVLDFLKKL